MSSRSAGAPGVLLPARSIAGCGDVSCEFLVDPIPRPAAAPFTIRMKPEKPQVVLLDSQKPNSIEILRLTQAILRQRGIDVKEEIRRKLHPGLPVYGELLEELSQERGLLLSGVND